MRACHVRVQRREELRRGMLGRICVRRGPDLHRPSMRCRSLPERFPVPDELRLLRHLLAQELHHGRRVQWLLRERQVRFGVGHVQPKARLKRGAGSGLGVG